MRKIIHLIPYDGIGGVEEAARSMVGQHREGTEFELRWLFPEVSSSNQRRATHNPLQILRTGIGIARENPDILIVSLWRAVIAGIVAKLLNRRIRLVVFIHNSKDAHRLDFLFTRLALWLADAVWSDSEASVKMRFKRPLRRPLTVISFLVNRLSPLEEDKDVAPRPIFAFWGRLAAQKNLPRALGIFARIKAQEPDAEFRIIGPDGGKEEILREKTADLEMQDAVHFLGALPFSQIPTALKGASFCLQTSDYEGMALSVTESMQMGLVPVVTPVGEIARYCQDGKNAVIIKDDEQAAQDTLALLKAPEQYQQMRSRAIQEWTKQPIYSDSIFDAINTLCDAGKTN